MRRVHSFGSALISGALVLAGCASCLFLVAAAAQAEQQAPPTVVEAAHQARTDKKPTGQSAKVWTNDNLPANDGAVSIVGQPAPVPVPVADKAADKAADKTGDESDAAKTGDKAAPDAAKAGAGSDDPAKKQLEIEVALDQAKQDVDRLGKELDLAQRDYSLQQQQFLMNANSSEDTDGQAYLAGVKDQVDAKQQELDKAKAHLEELQAELDQLHKNSPSDQQQP
jgi:hypothetical protein